MLEVSAIRRLLPHGHPVLLVDRVLAVQPGESIVAAKAITFGEPCYADVPPDAAPEQYAYPASLLLESFGQAAALLWLHGMDGSGLGDDRVLMLVAARDCRLLERAVPGDVLRHVARIERVVGDNVFVTGETYVGERRVAAIGSMMAAMRPRTALVDAPSALAHVDHRTPAR